MARTIEDPDADAAAETEENDSGPPLFESLNNRDIDAVERMFRAYEPRLRKVVRHQIPQGLRAKFDSVDVIQSVWMSVVPRLPRRRPAVHRRDPSSIIPHPARPLSIHRPLPAAPQLTRARAFPGGDRFDTGSNGSRRQADRDPEGQGGSQRPGGARVRRL